MMHKIKTLIISGCVLALAACAQEAGSFLDEGGFGNPTMNNTQIQNGDITFLANLNQRFTADAGHVRIRQVHTRRRCSGSPDRTGKLDPAVPGNPVQRLRTYRPCGLGSLQQGVGSETCERGCKLPGQPGCQPLSTEGTRIFRRNAAGDRHTQSRAPEPSYGDRGLGHG